MNCLDFLSNDKLAYFYDYTANYGVTFPDDFLDSLFDSNLLSFFLWKLVDDNESYVRATCIYNF